MNTHNILFSLVGSDSAHHITSRKSHCLSQLRYIYFCVRWCSGDNKNFRYIAACHAHLETRPDPDHTMKNKGDARNEFYSHTKY